MAQISDLPLKYRLFMQAYPYRWIDWRPGTRLSKPLPATRLALITTAGYFLPDQTPFDQSFRHDDCSYREIPRETPIDSLRIGQSSDAFDHAGIEADRNLAFPLDRLHELTEEGIVGEAAQRHFSLMGSIAAPKRLITESGPSIARKLAEDGTDAVFIAPVCPMCHHTAAIVQGIIERAGIPTVSISLLTEVTKRVEPPRVLAVDRPLGYPLGEPNNPRLQREILLAALRLLERSAAEPLLVSFANE